MMGETLSIFQFSSNSLLAEYIDYVPPIIPCSIISLYQMQLQDIPAIVSDA